MTELDLLIEETEQSAYVAAVLVERRMVASSEFLEKWQRDTDCGPDTLRGYVLQASSHLSSLYEFYGQLHAVSIRIDAQNKDQNATAYLVARNAATASGRPTPEADCKADVTRKMSEKLLTAADLDAAKALVDNRMRALDRMLKSGETVLRSLGDELRAFRA
jgi:hypothetical protein